MSLGKRIKTLRLMNNYTLQQLADKVELSISYLSDVENGRCNPSLSRLKDISSGLNTSVSYLLGEEVRETSSDYSKKEYDQINEFVSLLKDPYIKSIYPYIKKVKNWKIKDKRELETYLRIKTMCIEDAEQK